MVTSEAITEELSRIPDIQKRLRVEKIASVAQEFILIDEAIVSRMHELVAMGGMAMDSLHIACAERAGAVPPHLVAEGLARQPSTRRP